MIAILDKLLIIVTFTLMLGACRGGSSASIPEGYDPISEPEADFEVLFLGNSHSSHIPSILDKIITTAQPDKTTYFKRAPGNLFLIERMNDANTKELLESNQWSHLVLQALKYSSSGTNVYPTTGAEFFINRSHEMNATPILYPEHPRYGNTWESQYLYDLHSSVATNSAACVAPIGFVWEEVMSRVSVDLHATDGNHASPAGSFLTAMILYQVITGESVQTLPYIANVDVDQDIQDIMKESIVYILGTYDPCALL